MVMIGIRATGKNGKGSGTKSIMAQKQKGTSDVERRVKEIKRKRIVARVQRGMNDNEKEGKVRTGVTNRARHSQYLSSRLGREAASSQRDLAGK